MADADAFQRWELQQSDLANLTPVRARQLFIQCFFEAQKEMFARVDQKWGPRPTDTKLAEMVTEAVRLAFEEAGYDFDRPTKSALSSVLVVLTGKAEGWGTPQEIINHHKRQLMVVLERLE